MKQDILRIPILMYHEISESVAPERYSIDRTKFCAQLEHIRKCGFSGVSLKQVLNSKNLEANSSLILSFDDGHISNIRHALPILRDYDCFATFYVTTGRVGSSSDWLSWSDAGMLHNAGMDIQVHGHTHRFMDGMHYEEISYELEESIKLVSRHLGYLPQHLSFPGGRFNSNVIEQSRDMGFVSLATSRPGIASLNLKSRYPWLLDRILINKLTTLDDITNIVTQNTVYIQKARAMYTLKGFIKKVIGNDIYYGLWNRLWR